MRNYVPNPGRLSEGLGIFSLSYGWWWLVFPLNWPLPRATVAGRLVLPCLFSSVLFPPPPCARPPLRFGWFLLPLDKSAKLLLCLNFYYFLIYFLLWLVKYNFFVRYTYLNSLFNYQIETSINFWRTSFKFLNWTRLISRIFLIC